MDPLIKLTEDILLNGKDVKGRNGLVRTLTHQTISYDLSAGFPRLTARYVPFKSVAVELEGFIKGITWRPWFQERGCKFWDQWDKDLGPIYGYQWRRFNQSYAYPIKNGLSYHKNPKDQLNTLLNKLILNPSDRRLRVTSVNPLQEYLMQLPACHDYWKVDVVDGELDLAFHMRSWDVYLGAPANIQSYAMLAHLLARHAGFKPGKLTCYASNAHIYHNLLKQSQELIQRVEHPKPTIELDFQHFKDWDHTKVKCIGYNHSGKLEGPVSV